MIEEQLVKVMKPNYGKEYWCTFSHRHNCQKKCCQCPECGSSKGYYKEDCEVCYSCDMAWHMGDKA